jgi:hypothetical protein
MKCTSLGLLGQASRRNGRLPQMCLTRDLQPPQRYSVTPVLKRRLPLPRDLPQRIRFDRRTTAGGQRVERATSGRDAVIMESLSARQVLCGVDGVPQLTAQRDQLLAVRAIPAAPARAAWVRDRRDSARTDTPVGLHAHRRWPAVLAAQVPLG